MATLGAAWLPIFTHAAEAMLATPCAGWGIACKLHPSMIITCPSCSANFSVPDAAVTAEGRVVRCGKCSHVWTEYPPPAIRIPTAEDNYGIAEERPHKPAKPTKPGKVPRERKEFKGIKIPARLQGVVNPKTLPLTAAIVTWLLLGAVAMATSGAWAPYILPAQMDDDSMRMISLDGISAQRAGDKLVVAGQLHNLTEAKILLPDLNISVKEHNKDPIMVGSVSPPQRAIGPEESLAIKAELPLQDEAQLNQGDVLVQFAKVPRKLSK